MFFNEIRRTLGQDECSASEIQTVKEVLEQLLKDRSLSIEATQIGEISRVISNGHIRSSLWVLALKESRDTFAALLQSSDFVAFLNKNPVPFYQLVSSDADFLNTARSVTGLNPTILADAERSLDNLCKYQVG